MLVTLEGLKLLVQELRAETGLRVFVAGGAVRDLLLDRAEQLNDVDLWVYAKDITSARRAFDESGLLGTLNKRVGGEGASLGRDGGVVAIDYYAYMGVEFNVIYMRDPFGLASLLNDFDFGVNQAGIGPDGIETTAAFEEARDELVLRVTRRENTPRDARRITHMKQKFPTWRFVDLPAPYYPHPKPPRHSAPIY